MKFIKVKYFKSFKSIIICSSLMKPKKKVKTHKKQLLTHKTIFREKTGCVRKLFSFVCFNFFSSKKKVMAQKDFFYKNYSGKTQIEQIAHYCATLRYIALYCATLRIILRNVTEHCVILRNIAQHCV